MVTACSAWFIGGVIVQQGCAVLNSSDGTAEGGGRSETTDIPKKQKKNTHKGSAYSENLASVVIVCLLCVLTNKFE